MKRLKSCLALGVCLACGSVYAAPIEVSGDFSIGSAASPIFDMENFSGSFSFTFDDSAIASTGYTSFYGVALDSLTLSPNYGGFDTSNVFGFIQFLDGAFDLAILGARIGGTDDELSVFSGTNDFLIEFYQSFSLNDWAIAKTGFLGVVDEESGVPFSGSLSVGATPVPEPPLLSLFVLGLVALGFGRRRLPPHGAA